MALFIDSANLDEIREAVDLGFIAGVTTNPTSLVKAGHKDFYATLQQICEIMPGTVFYQLTSHSQTEMLQEFNQFREIAPNLALKIPCDLAGLKFAAQVSKDIPVGMTAIFTPSQAYLAAQAGASYVLPFVNRATRYSGAGLEMLASVVDVLSATACEVLAVSIKTPSEVVDILRLGADHISIPLDLIKEMADSGLTQQAMHEFDQNFSKIRG